MKPFALAALAALTLSLLAAPARADEDGVGLFVSNIAGSGLTYRHVFSSGMGFHVSGIGWSQNGSGFVNAGAAVTKELGRKDWGSLYALLATGIGLSTSPATIGVGSNGSPLPSAGGRADLQVNLAPGIGFHSGPFFAEVGYSFYQNSSGSGFVPAGGVGLMWTF